MLNVYIETYGCTANQNNSEILAGLLSQAGLSITENIDIADIVIINTCIVKDPTLQTIVTRIADLTKLNKKLIIAGCLPDIEILAKRIKRIAPKASLIGSHHFKEVNKAIKRMMGGEIVTLTNKQQECRLSLPKRNQNRAIGITQISEGCLGECSYCLVRHAKGKLFSYKQEDIIKNVKRDLEAGCKEIWITSQDNAAYGLDNGKREIITLLNKVLSLKGKFYVRLGMMNPNNVLPILEDLIKIYKNKKMFKFLHIPLQSGSDEILKKMKRNYTADKFLKIINKFKKEIPDLAISTDVICGFPSETEKDFEETFEIVKRIKPQLLNISRFWPMPNTPASRMKQISRDIVRERSTKMMEEHVKIALSLHKEFIGKEEKCLVDKKGFKDTWLCRDENYRLIVVNSNENILGKFINVKIKDTKPHYLFGEIIDK